MRISEVKFGTNPPVESYGPGFFRLGGALVRGPVLLGPGGPRTWPGLPDTGAILELRDAIDVVLMGMGAEIRALGGPEREALEEAGIGAEIMATPAACRTYNVLLSEGRRIAAALMPI